MVVAYQDGAQGTHEENRPMAGRFSPTSHTLAEVVDGEAVLLNAQSGEYFTLNATGTRIWQLLCELGDEDAVLRVLEIEFAADRSALAADFGRITAALVESGLLEDLRAG